MIFKFADCHGLGTTFRGCLSTIPMNSFSSSFIINIIN
jgi:hypothetical protein